MINSKKKKQNINQELTLGAGTLALIFPAVLTAVTFSLIGVVGGILLLIGSDDTPTITALTMIVVYGTALAVFCLAMKLFTKRFRLLLDRMRALQDEQQRINEMLSAEHRLADHDLLSSLLEPHETETQNEHQYHV